MRFLLYLYPAGFRAEYGEEIRAIFDKRRRDAGFPGALAFWLEAVPDLLWNAFLAHADILRQDLRYALRMLARSPGFALTAIIVAALGIGATTAAFTIIDHVLIRPLGFAGPDRLVKLYEDHSHVSGSMGRDWDMAPANYRDWKRMSKSFSSMGCFSSRSVSLVGVGDPKLLNSVIVSGDLFATLGVPALIGRVFTMEDDREKAPATVVLGYSLWQTEFAGDRGVLGRKLLLDHTPYTVIGVMPKGFYFPDRAAQLWTTMRFGPAAYQDRNDNFIYGIARLKSGVSPQQAQAELTTIARQLERAYPKELAHIGATVIPLHQDIGSQPRFMLWVLLAAAACVLLIASTNLAGLMLARALTRRKELAVRTALGAGRERLARQMLTESLLLALAGGATGVALATAAMPLLVKLVPVYLPIPEAPEIDWRVLAFALAVTLGTGIGFGVIPALRLSRAGDGLRETSRAGGGRRERFRSSLVVAEVAGCVVLLICCGLLLRALWRIQAVDPGFQPDHVLTLQTTLAVPKYERLASQKRFIDEVLSGAQRLPGVTSAGYISLLPMVDRGGVWPVEVQEHPLPPSERLNASLRFVTPGLFAALGVTLQMGRNVSASDTMEAPAAVVSQSFVRRYWPNTDPIGHHFHFGDLSLQLVGVVNDVRVRGLERNSEPQVYLPYLQFNPVKVSSFYAPKHLVVRGTGDLDALMPSLRKIIHHADPEMPISHVRLLTDIVSADTAPRRVQLGALGAFALIALLLAAIGIHGLLSFVVTSRTQEIGVRMALGANAGQILRMILWDGLLLGTLGITLGIILAYGAGKSLEALLAGVRPNDAVTLASAMVLCLAMTLAGSLLPAWRALRVDPTTAIRVDC